MWDFICEYILPIFLVILIILAIVVIGIFIYNKIQFNNYLNKKDYIQNIEDIEEKLNIYERSYEEFCLEDNKKQGGID